MKKKLICTLTFVSIAIFAFGQTTEPDSSTKECRNIFEVSINSLLHQILYTGGEIYSFGPTYIVSYKRIYNSNALRFGIGGYRSTDNYTTSDTIKNSTSSSGLNLGLGIEHYCYLAKKFNYYYGCDLVFRYNVAGNDIWSGSELLYKMKNTNYGYGFSPLLGIQFKLNSRMSFSTETNYSIIIKHGITKRTNNSFTPANTEEKYNGMYTNFGQLMNINFRLHF